MHVYRITAAILSIAADTKSVFVRARFPLVARCASVGPRPGPSVLWPSGPDLLGPLFAAFRLSGPFGPFHSLVYSRLVPYFSHTGYQPYCGMAGLSSDSSPALFSGLETSPGKRWSQIPQVMFLALPTPTHIWRAGGRRNQKKKKSCRTPTPGAVPHHLSQ